MREIKVPELAESIMEGTISEWLVKEGEYVEKGDPIIDLETDKVNVEVHAEYSGVITEILRAEGDDVEVGDVIAMLDENASASKTDTAPEEVVAQEEAPKQAEPVAKQENEERKVDVEEQARPSRDIIASPAARKRARELNIDLSKIQPHEIHGRIRVEDVEAAAKQQSEQLAKVSQSSQPANLVADSNKPFERIPMSRRRMTIAKRLVEAQHTAAMLTTFNEVDMTAVMNLRNERKDKFFEKHGVKLGFMSFFTKAVVGALRDFPLLNAEIQGNDIILKKYYDIGIAVSTEEGLVVPVVRDADKLDFAGIESEIMRLATLARDNQLQLADLQGGTFTITNGGIFGSMLSTPILNAPQVGILGMHNIQKRAVVMPDDTIEVRPMMYIALSYDHRIIDGKDAVQFLVRIKELIEDPYDLLLEG